MSEPNPTYATAPAYCTDEDIAVYSPGDAAILTPASAVVAGGADGAFAPDSPWTLSSASVDFEAQGARRSMLVVLEGGTATGGGAASVFKGSGQHFAVEAAVGKTLTLRRIGFPAGVGQPPGPAGGAAGVRFAVCTLGPQIGQASDEINRRFGVDAAIAGRGPLDLADARDLELATVLTVLARQYTVNTRTGDGDFAYKLRTIRADLDAVLARLQLRWRPPGDGSAPASMFGMRIARG